MPYGPPATYVPREYRSPYAGTIGQLLGQNNGAIWGNAINTLGGIASDAFRQRAEEKQRKQLEESARQQDTAFQDLLQNGDGLPDPKAVLSIYGPERGSKIVNGLASFAQITQKQGDDARTHLPGLISGMSALSPDMQKMMYPQVRTAAIRAGIFPENALPPEWTPEIGQEIMKLGQGMSPQAKIGTKTIEVRGPDGSITTKIVEDKPGQEFTSAPTPPTLKASTWVVRGGKVIPIQPGMEQPGDRPYEKPGAPPTVSLQAKEVLNDEGKPVMATFNSRTGRYSDQNGVEIKNPQPLPSDRVGQDQAKFKKAAPVISAMAELSEKINTGSGLIAKASGGAARIAAKANYDDDVAEYDALISGFTPMVARAVGHTGVLTELDVQSVRKLFPAPGDSKTLRDRKVARLRSIMSELETVGSAGASGQVDPNNAQTPKKKRYNPATGKIE